MSPVSSGAAELHKFVLRSQVLSQYRKFLRVVRQVPDPGSRDDIAAEVRREFRLHSNAPDAYAIKYHLSDGRTRLKQLEEMMGLRR